METHTSESGSKEKFDFICSPCERRNTATVQALYYCTDCDELMCKTCLEFHASLPGLKEHKVLGRDKLKSWGKRKKSMHVFTEQCPRHDGKFVELFCCKHDDLCCHVCVYLEHRVCEDLKYIPEVATGIGLSLELQELNKNLDQVKANVEKIKTNREQNKAKLEKSRKDVLENMKDFRKRVNQMLDALEKKTIDDLEQLHGDSKKDLMADMKTCDNFIAELQQLKHHLEKTSRNHESQVFINMKKCEKRVSDGNQLIEEMLTTNKTESFKFTIDQSIESFLANILSLGKLEVKTTSPEVKGQRGEEQEPIRLYEAQNARECSIKMKGDTETCNIIGSCQMPDNSILLADYNNDTLKHLDTSYRVITHCDISSSPRAVCCISQKEAAVSDYNNAVNFVSVSRNKMAVTRSIKMNHDCWGLAYNNGQLYISDDDNRVYIYNTSGTCLRMLYKDNNGVEMFSQTRHIAVSPDGTEIYVADLNKGLVTLDNNGQLLSTFRDQDFSNAVGVCVDGWGNVFVSGWISHNVMQLDETATQKMGVVAKLGSTKNIWSVLIDQTNSTMLLTMLDCDSVTVFDLK